MPDLSPAIALGAFSSAYMWGVRRGHVSRAKTWCFAAAILVMATALLSPLDGLSEQLFTAHMIQHMLLAAVAPPLIVLAAPDKVLLWAFPVRGRRLGGRLRARTHGLVGFVTAPVVAWALHASAIWVWHMPRLYERALTSDVAHATEHLAFVGTGCLLWWSILARRRYALGIILLFGTAVHSGALGALLAFSNHVLYPAQTAAASHWGLTPLDDQRLAGLIMWVPGGVLYVVAVSVLFVVWLDPPARRRASRAALGTATAAGAALSGCGRAQASGVQGGNPERGRQTIEAMGCGACHVIAGVPGARGEVGPPLSGVARRAIIGGVLPNTPQNMMAWIEDPPSLAPRTAMPNLGVTPQAARDIVAYLYTLR